LPIIQLESNYAFTECLHANFLKNKHIYDLHEESLHQN